MGKFMWLKIKSFASFPEKGGVISVCHDCYEYKRDKEESEGVNKWCARTDPINTFALRCLYNGPRCSKIYLIFRRTLGAFVARKIATFSCECAECKNLFEPNGMSHIIKKTLVNKKKMLFFIENNKIE